MPASRTQERPRRRKANDEIAPNAPTRPDPPKRCGFIEKTAPRGPGAGICAWQPPPLLSSLHRLLGVARHLHPTNHLHHAAGPSGAADFPCLRQLPPPPKKRQRKGGARSRRTIERKRRKREREKERAKNEKAGKNERLESGKKRKAKSYHCAKAQNILFSFIFSRGA